MTIYVFRALDGIGQPQTGELEAPAPGAVLALLQERGLIPVEVRERDAAPEPAKRASTWAFTGARSSHVPRRALVEFTEQLALLLRARIDLDRALGLVAAGDLGAALQAIVQALRRAVRDGETLSRAMERYPGAFSKTYLNLVRTGEATGKLADMLTTLAEQTRRALTLREGVASTLIYPAILLTVTGLSLVLILTFVLPRFGAVFEQSGSLMPLSTRLLLGAGESIREGWWVLLLGSGAIGAAVAMALRDPLRRRALDAYLLRVRFLQGLLCDIELARFARTLGLLVDNGVTLAGALPIAGASVHNRQMAADLEHAAVAVRHGQGVAAALAALAMFPEPLLQMIRIGEESGRLGAMLLEVAAVCERRLELRSRRLLALLEPVVILVLAGFVALVVFALLSAVLGLSDLAA